MNVLGAIPGVGFEPNSRAACIGRDLIVTAGVALALGVAGLAFAASLPQMQLVFSNPMLITTSLTSILAGGYLVTQSILSCCLKNKVTTLFEKIRECVKKIGLFIGVLFLLAGATALASSFIPQLTPYLFTTRMIAAGVTAFTALLFLGLEWRLSVKAPLVENKRKEAGPSQMTQNLFIQLGQKKLAPYQGKLCKLFSPSEEEAFWKQLVGKSAEEHFEISEDQIARAKNKEETYEEYTLFLMQKIQYILALKDHPEMKVEKLNSLVSYLYNVCILFENEKDCEILMLLAKKAPGITEGIRERAKIILNDVHNKI